MEEVWQAIHNGSAGQANQRPARGADSVDEPPQSRTASPSPGYGIPPQSMPHLRLSSAINGLKMQPESGSQPLSHWPGSAQSPLDAGHSSQQGGRHQHAVQLVTSLPAAAASLSQPPLPGFPSRSQHVPLSIPAASVPYAVAMLDSVAQPMDVVDWANSAAAAAIPASVPGQPASAQMLHIGQGNSPRLLPAAMQPLDTNLQLPSLSPLQVLSQPAREPGTTVKASTVPHQDGYSAKTLHSR